MANKTNKIVLLPIKVALGFLIFTELFFFLGPIEFKNNNAIVLILFLVLVNLCMYWGYKNEIKQYRPHYSKFSGETAKVIKFVEFLVVIALITKPISMFVAWQLESFSLDAFFNKFVMGLLSPKDVYDDFNNLKGGSFFSLINVLISPLTYMAIPCGIYYFKKQKIIFRILIILLILLEIITCLGLGIRKKLLDIILIVSFSYLASRGNKPIKLFQNSAQIILFCLAVVGLLYYFTYSTLSRGGTDDITAFYTNNRIRFWYINHTSPEFYMSLANVQFYVSHAYENLGVALDHFFNGEFSYVFSFGLGNNSFTLDVLNRYFGIDLNPFTYQYLLNTKYGLNIGQSWMTIYPWLANDVTFVGVPFVIFFIGKLLARFWLDSLNRANFYAIPLFSFAIITVFYSFANNQGLSYSFIPFVVISTLYIRTKNNQSIIKS